MALFILCDVENYSMLIKSAYCEEDEYATFFIFIWSFWTNVLFLPRCLSEIYGALLLNLRRLICIIWVKPTIHISPRLNMIFKASVVWVFHSEFLNFYLANNSTVFNIDNNR